ncbi:UNVERIFIED_CONTAM: hypothetical protein Sangu_0679900 [Sesamum angustifolium]|uniref:Uncharacterized protein n=1 Tax=Sesamum angustifolium TaxID=2727405 RepID=A0AAW2PQ03_9LAMI
MLGESARGNGAERGRHAPDGRSRPQGGASRSAARLKVKLEATRPPRAGGARSTASRSPAVARSGASR